MIQQLILLNIGKKKYLPSDKLHLDLRDRRCGDMVKIFDYLKGKHAKLWGSYWCFYSCTKQCHCINSHHVDEALSLFESSTSHFLNKYELSIFPLLSLIRLFGPLLPESPVILVIQNPTNGFLSLMGQSVRVSRIFPI